MDAVRKGEVHSQPDLRKTRWLWLKKERNLKEKQKAQLQDLLKNQNLKTAQAYQPSPMHWDKGYNSKESFWNRRDVSSPMHWDKGYNTSAL